MKKPILVVLSLLCAAIAGAAIIHRQGQPAKPMGTCFGRFPCTACYNCTECRYCHVLGGKCGVCSKAKDPFSKVDFSKDLDAATVKALRDRQRAHALAAR